MIPSFVNNLFDEPAHKLSGFALEAFLFQRKQNRVYEQFCELLPVKKQPVTRLEDLPFLPIRFFKSHQVVSRASDNFTVFESSGTTQSIPSRHYVADPFLYQQSFLKGFERVYGQPQHWCILGLLPSYLERQHSSLVYMVEHLMQKSAHPLNGFYLHNHEELFHALLQLEQQQQPVLLFGVTFALLDFANRYPAQLRYTTVIETGGMKGRREELLREEVHIQLKQQLGLREVHSEYGMTELLSQAYSKGNGLFECPPWMKVLVRQEDDPLSVAQEGKGALNIIDLANSNSCCFLATDDVGEVYADGTFRVLGRLDNSDVRGCSLLAL